MVNITRRRLATAMVLAPFARVGSAQTTADYPIKALRIIVPYGAGDGTDIITRSLGIQLSNQLKVPVIIENKPGAAGLLGATALASAAPDGYTLGLISSALVTQQTLYKRPELDMLGQFAPVSNLASAPFCFLVPPESPFKTLADLITAIKARPGQLNMATGGIGSPAHMSFELFRSIAGNLSVNHIPYKSGMEATLAVVTKDVDFASGYIGSVLPLALDKKVRVLAMTSSARLPQLKDVPTVSETYPGFAFTAWIGYAVPAKTPPAIVKVLHAAILSASQSVELRGQLLQLAHVLTVSASPGEFSGFIKSGLVSEQELIKERGIVPST